MDVALLTTTAFAGALVIQLLFFIIALRKNRVDIIDTAWGLSFIAAIGSMLLHSSKVTLTVLVLALFITIWGLRLSLHIGRRFAKSNIQDKRYTNTIAKWPASYRWMQIFFRLFVLQASLATIIVLPFAVSLALEVGTGIYTYIGAVIWLTGFGFELVADRQLRHHIRFGEKNSLMTTGLWRYSRHPNYFGEILMWWAIAAISFHPSTWVISVSGAATITVLICFISGIPLAEKSAKSKHGWQQYQRRTSVLIPLPPRK